MHELMRERFWNLFVAIKHQCYYYRFFKKHCDNKIAALKIFLTAVSCAGISAWAIWDFLPGALPVVLAAAQILSVCQDYFPFAKQSSGIEYLLPDLELLCISIETDWNKIDDMSSQEIIDKIEYYERSTIDLQNKYLSSFAFLYNKQSEREAQQENMKFFASYSSQTLTKEGVTAE